MTGDTSDEQGRAGTFEDDDTLVLALDLGPERTTEVYRIPGDREATDPVAVDQDQTEEGA